MSEYINSKLAASSDSRHGCRELMADKNVDALLVLDNSQLKDAPCPRYTTLDNISVG
jgi:hypothetical protein